MRSRRVWVSFLAAAMVFAFCLGVAALFDEAQAKGPCRCPMVYAPVECDKGKIYPNQCVADCRNAKNCVPIGVF